MDKAFYNSLLSFYYVQQNTQESLSVLALGGRHMGMAKYTIKSKSYLPMLLLLITSLQADAVVDSFSPSTVSHITGLTPSKYQVWPRLTAK